MSVQSVASYVWGNCTYWVARSLDWVPGGLGDAKNWLVNAQRKGYKISATPHAGDVVVYGPGNGYSQLGHVAVVKSVDGPGHFTVSEMNFKGLGITDTRQSSMHGVMGFIEPPNSAQHASSGQNPNPFAQWLLSVAGFTAGQAAQQGQNFVNFSMPGVSFNVSNPLQGFTDWIQSNVWRAALIVFGLVTVLVGFIILFHQPIEYVQQQTAETAKDAGEAAAVAG